MYRSPGSGPINTSTVNEKFITLGLPFLLVVLIPWWLLHKTDPGIIVYKLLSQRWSKLEIGYTLLSIPLAYAAFRLYFGMLSPEVPYR